MRVVAEAEANAPKVLISTTPSTPTQPGQTVVATIRADGYSRIQTLAVKVRGIAVGAGADADQWQTIALDSAGRLKLAPTQPGLIDIEVTAIDLDGFATTRAHTIRVKDPLDTQAPSLQWGGALAGATAVSEPVTLTELTQLQAALQDRQLMGYKVEIVFGNSSQWQTLAEQLSAASNISETLTLASIDPSMLHNGVYKLRLSAWDLVGRTTELNAHVIVDTVNKAFDTQSATDEIYTLGGHEFALTRLLETGAAGADGNDFGNWSMPALDFRLTNPPRQRRALSPHGRRVPESGCKCRRTWSSPAPRSNISASRCRPSGKRWGRCLAPRSSCDRFSPEPRAGRWRLTAATAMRCSTRASGCSAR